MMLIEITRTQQNDDLRLRRPTLILGYQLHMPEQHLYKFMTKNID